jgi:hypothetical protein
MGIAMLILQEATNTPNPRANLNLGLWPQLDDTKGSQQNRRIRCRGSAIGWRSPD